MPVQVFDRSDIEDILIAKPDSRFATTFISNKYRRYAVNGETLQDKATGEIFTRRPEDGRVVSFFQNKKYMHDLMMELKVVISSNDSFIYPDESQTNAFYVSTDYDIMTINDDNENDISTNDTIIPNDDTNYHNIKYPISTLSNGFFCRLTSRDSDKVVINWITNKYDNIIKNYSGSDEEYLTEKKKFDDIPEWDDSNAVVDYTVIMVNNSSGETTETKLTNYIHINEEHSIEFPDYLVPTYYEEDYSVYVIINKISYPKIHFIINHMDDEMKAEYEKFVYPDNKILATYFNVMSFIDSSDDIIINNNEFIVAMVDVPYCISYMRKIARIAEATPIKLILSPIRPSDDTWLQGGIWAESVRHVFAGGYVVNTNSETAISTLERFISDSTDSTFYSPIIDIVESNSGGE